MKRFLLIVLFLLLAFYVAWPAFSVWQMYSSVRAGDAKMLKKKVDFSSVRASMSPAVEATIAAHVEKLKRDGGTTGAIVSSVVDKSLLRDVSKVVLDHLVTAENIIRMSREPGTLSEKIDRAVARAFGGTAAKSPGAAAPPAGQNVVANPGAAGAPTTGGTRQEGKPAPPVVAQPGDGTTATTSPTPHGAAPPKFGLANLKGFRMIDPLAFEIDVAKDAASPSADATAHISFQNFDWKLTGVVPHPK
jgi:Protein of unknown function (DUF2939)